MPTQLKLTIYSLLHSLKHSFLGSISCMQTYFYLDEVSRHWKSYLQKSITGKMTGKYLYTSSQTKKNKEDSHIFFNDLDLLYHLMPSNTLVLGPYELSI